ncbi:hypothetical protein [Mycoplasma struthionis]|uniref:Transketolase N-terminal domain-containing protein n=1 Tax=Mycoplasma struthionis TaxID=538220 RepID=A0A502M280_9MOLU|nr:hypothetical protein [Mycoplasma struthionis]TPI01581.1 hypothetical protein FJM01_02370 [Mycoplasma struthionis]
MKINKKFNERAIDNLKVNALALAKELINDAPNSIISSAKIFHSLYFYHLNYDFQNPNWMNRDRLILSSADSIFLHYSILNFLGYLDLKDGKQETKKLTLFSF